MREIGTLVFPSHHATELNVPDLFALGWVTDRLEGNRDFQSPAIVEFTRARVPDWIPLAVALTLADELRVAHRSQRFGHEVVTAAMVVEGVDDDRKILVLQDVLRRVAAHLVDHHPLGMAVPHPRRHI